MDALAHRFSDWLRDALAVVLPVCCVVCGQPDRRICSSCRAQLDPVVTLLSMPGLLDHPASQSSPGSPTSLEGPSSPTFPIVSAGPYGGSTGEAVVSAIHALKDEYRTGIARDLAPRLRASVNRLLSSHSPADILFVAPPSSRANFQARGFEPIDLLAWHARIPLSRELRAVRTRVDQSGLGVSERDDNMRGSMSARRPLGGASVILIDDVMTTGATLREMARAIRAAGGRVVGAATVAHTPRRHPQRHPQRNPQRASSPFAENA